MNPTGSLRQVFESLEAVSGIIRIQDLDRQEEGQSCKCGHSWDTRGELQGGVQQLLDDYWQSAVLIERAVSYWQLHQLISQTTQYLDSWLSYLLQSELKMKLLEVEGETCPSAI